MVKCVAYKCSNRPDKDKKKNEKRSYFRFPHLEKDKERCERWLHNIGREDMQLSNFVWNTNKTVCSDHFHPSCVLPNIKASVMPNYRPAKEKVELKPGSIPTIFSHKVYEMINISGEMAESERGAEGRAERERKEVRN